MRLPRRTVQSAGKLYGQPGKTKFDFLPALLIVAFVLFGLLMVYDSSSASAIANFSDKYYFLKEQIKWAMLGLVGFAVGFVFDYRKLKPLALPFLVVGLVLLVAVFLPGIGVRAYGAYRWINLGFTVVQPSELAKLILIIYLSTWLSCKEKGRWLPFLLLIGLFVGLVMLQPDMGTAIVLLGISFTIYFLSERNLGRLLLIIPFIVLGGVGLALHSPYRLKRLMTFIDPSSDPLGASYHVRQALLALGSGGLWGLGFGNSRQKYYYLPEANTDSIFAIIAEEVGFVGSSVFLLAFTYLLYRCYRNTLNVEESFGKFLGLGIVTWFSLQTAINIGSMVALTPLTGVPLPFVSYGGSALVMELVGAGILFNIWKINRR